MSAEFLEKYHGVLKGVMKWEKLDELWSSIRNHKEDDWYIYAPGHEIPEKTADRDDVDHFLARMDRLLRDEHDEDYCGIVYTDDFDHPSLVKIFDPNNLGVSCGSSSNPPLPGWIMSLSKPEAIGQDAVVPGNRRRWWSKLWN
jgi:hypothetical protein